MRKIICKGCGMSEDVNATKHKIGEVTINISTSPREWEGNKEYKEDLCPTCIGTLLHNYFGISAEGSLPIPAFVERIRVPESSQIRLIKN